MKFLNKATFPLLLLLVVFSSTPLFAVDYYWVGGKGNWSQISHWATTSGGGTKHATAPTQNDNVYFDVNSGFLPLAGNNIVTLDGVSNTCKDMIWNGAPQNPILLGAASKDLNIYGSLQLQAGMTYKVNATYFKSDISGQTIKTNNVSIGISAGTFNGNMIFNGNGDWTLLDDLFTGGGTSRTTVSLIKGGLKTNGFNVNITTFLSSGNEVRSLNLGNSIITLRSGGWSFDGWTYVGTNKSLNSGTSSIEFVNAFTNASFYGFKGDNMDNYYHISTLNVNSSISFSFDANVHVQKLDLVGSSIIKQDCTIDSLLLNGGKQYNFITNVTIGITNLIRAVSSTCTIDPILGTPGYTELISGGANLNITSGATVDIDRALITNLNAIGPDAPFTVINGIDNGGNTGFYFPIIPTGRTLYWVGGAGNWNDVSHWSLLNNGIYSPLSGECIPTPSDTVIFNINSGFLPLSNTVTLNASGHYCKMMKWQGAANNPKLIGGINNKLVIYGSIELQSGMDYFVHSTYFISVTLLEKITTNGTIIGNPIGTTYPGNIYLSGSGKWTLQDDLTTGGSGSTNGAGSIYFNSGSINTNGKKLTIYSFISNSNNIRELTLGSSEITIRSDFGNNDGWNYTGSNKILNSGTSHIIFVGSITSNTHTTFNGDNNDVYFDITYTDPNSTVAAFYGTVKAHKIVFFGSARFKGNSEIDSLILASSKSYLFVQNTTLKINEYFKASSSSCDGLISLSAWQTSGGAPTLPAKLKFAPVATILINGVLISYINVISAPIIANNSIDNGNNINITFPIPSGAILYWVGGKGNWNDRVHWSLNNDGVFPASSGGCVPTPIDDVVFNNNSGFVLATDSVILDGIQHYCKDMTWVGATNNPVIFGEDSKFLNVYGSFMLQPNMRYRVTRTNFKSDAPNQTITTNGIVIGGTSSVIVDGHIKFDGKGEWILQDDLTTYRLGTINFNSGTLNTNGVNVNTYVFTSTKNEIRNLLLGSSTITITHNNSEWVYTGNNKSLNAGTSHIILIANQNSLNNLHFLGDKNDQYYNISFTNPLSLRAGINGPVKINKLFYAGNGNMVGNNSIDTLIFTAGRTYEFDAGKTQTINKAFYPSGNPCFFTTINSSSSTKARVNVMAGNVNYNYVTIKDVNATGSYTNWNFGSQSVNAGNNSGMVFAPYNAAATIAGLGPSDIFISTCNTFADTILKTGGFFANPSTTYLWNDGTTADTLKVTSSGTYSITVNYGQGCVIQDAITLACPLPIELIHFDVVKNDNFSTLISWTTGSERDNKQFEVYRSDNLKDWKLVGVVEGAGNSSVAHSYQLIDNTITQNGTYYYFLKQIDYNNKSESFSPKSVIFSNSKKLISIYPNPASDLVNIDISYDGIDEVGTLYLIDVAGKIVLQETVDISSEYQQIRMNVSPLPAGMYTIRFTSEGMEFPVHKLVITR